MLGIMQKGMLWYTAHDEAFKWMHSWRLKLSHCYSTRYKLSRNL